MSSDSLLVDLPPEECLARLRQATVGRLVVVGPDAAPLVFPVNFVLDGDVVVFRSGPGTKVAALRTARVAFQVDWVDPFHETGWSVLVHGVAYEATPWEVQHLGLRSWVGGTKPHWVRIVPTQITGRAIHLADIERDPRGYL